MLVFQHPMESGTHQMKLLKPRTRIATPVNCSTSARLESNASISSGILDEVSGSCQNHMESLESFQFKERRMIDLKGD